MKTHNYHPRLALLAIAFSLVACSNSGPAGTTAAAPAPSGASATAATGPITSGVYKVCRVSDDITDHEDGLSREHVHQTEVVTVDRIDADSFAIAANGLALKLRPAGA